MLWKLLQRTFNGGQLDHRLGGRTDLTKYFQGASVLENFIVKRQGCIVRRRGTFELTNVSAVTNQTGITNIRMLPFSYDKNGGFVIILMASITGSYLRVFSSNGSLAQSIKVPYAGSEFSEIGYTQSGDNLYLAHREHPLARLHRKSDGTWEYAVIDFSKLGNASIPATPTLASVKGTGFASSGTASKRTVNYRVTAVVGGVESKPSETKSYSYYPPWPDGATITINIKKSSKNPDAFNIYKQMINGTWGYIGTTDEVESTSASGALENVSVIPSLSSSAEESSLAKIRSYDKTDPSNTPGRSELPEFDGRNSGGYNFKNGSFTVGYGSGEYVGTVYLGLGWAGITSESPLAFQRIGCAAKKIKAVVSFANGTTKTFGPFDVSSRAQSNRSQSPASGSDAEWPSEDYAFGETIAVEIFPKGSTGIVNVTQVKFTAYSDNECSIVAKGAVAFDESTGLYTATGSPFVVNSVYSTRYASGSKTSYSFVDEYITPDATLSPPTYEAHFDKAGDFPSCVGIYQQRLALSTTDNQPFTFWMSCVADLYNFNTHDSIREDDAIEYTLSATKYPDINHMVVNRDLILFCDSGEWIVTTMNGNTASYKTLMTKIQSQIGCSKGIAPLIVGDDILFVNETNEALIAIRYSYASDGYEATDLSVLSQDIFRGNPITSMAYKQHPDSIVVVTLTDGTFATLEYMKEHEVVAWSHHQLGGGLKAIACTADGSNTNGTTDVYMLAKDDSGAYHLLRVKEDLLISSVENAVSLDQMEVVVAKSGDIVPIGCVAVCTSDGSILAAGGGLTANARYIVGKKFTSTFVSVKPEPNSSESVRFEIKNPTEVEVSVTEGSTFRVGQYGMPESKDREVVIRPTIGAGGVYSSGDVDKAVIVAGANNRDGRIRLTADGVWPLTVLSISTTYQIEAANQEPRKVDRNEGD